MSDLTLFVDEGHDRAQGIRLPAAAGARSRLIVALGGMLSQGLRPLSDKCVVNIHGTTAHWNHGYSPCLTRSRCGSSGHWLTWMQRFMSLTEMLSLQGFKRDWFPEHLPVSERQMSLLCGNAIPVPLLGRVMQHLLVAANLA